MKTVGGEGKLKVGLVGCGHISEMHLRAWRRLPHFRIAGLFDVNRSLAMRRARQFHVEVVYDELSMLISDCDVIDVCTPPQTHAKIAQHVIDAGRHLIIEKPLVTDVDDWEILRVGLSRSPSKIAVVHNKKFMQSIRQAKRWTEDGLIGDVLGIERKFLTSPKTDRMLVGSSHWSHSLPGGRWFETLPHELYLIHHFLGPLDLASVIVLHTSRDAERARADEVLVTFHGAASMAMIHYSANCDMNARTMTIYGTRGIIMVDILSDFAYLSRISDSKWRRAVGSLPVEAGLMLARWIPDRLDYLQRRVRRKTAHAAFIEAFGRYVQAQGPAPTPLEEIEYAIRYSDAIGREIDKQLTTWKGLDGSHALVQGVS